MRILILNWRDIRHPLSGGAETSLHEHAKYWKKMGNEIIWFSSSFPGAKKEEIIDEITFVRKGSHYTVHIWAFLYLITGRFKTIDIVIDSFHFLPFFTPLYFSKKKIIALINEIAGKVWFANLPYPFAIIGFHTEPFFFYFYKKIPFITGSNSTSDELKKNGIKTKDIIIIHHGINVVADDKKIKKEEKPTLVFLGRVSDDKGIKDVIETYLQVKKTISTTQLWIIGKEEKKGMIASLLKSIEQKKIKADITYFGFVTEERKIELLRRAWLLIHPSQKEGWGLNVIEAATQGTPTIGYNVEGLRDSVKNGITGILVDSQNPSLLSNAILSITMDKTKKLYNTLSKNARVWSKNFNWNKSTKQSWDIVRNTYDNKNR